MSEWKTIAKDILYDGRDTVVFGGKAHHGSSQLARIALAAEKWRDHYRKKLRQAKTEKYRLAIKATLRVIDDILIGEGPRDE